jgi:hypothetical protein
MAFGAQRVAVPVLIELHQQLIERGFRRSPRNDPTIVQKEQDEEPGGAGAAVYGPASAQLAVRLREGFERSAPQSAARRSPGWSACC